MVNMFHVSIPENVNYLSRISKTRNMPVPNENSKYLFLFPDSASLMKLKVVETTNFELALQLQ